MWGQWCGQISGSNSGSIILNIDADSPNVGKILMADSDPNNTSFYADINIVREQDKFTGYIENFVVFAPNSSQQQLEALQDSLPTQAQISGDIDNDVLKGTWFSNNDTQGEVELISLENYTAAQSNRTMSWSEFQLWILTEKKNNPGLIFRGQPDSSYGLKTSFHRQERRDLIRYLNQDIPELAKYITAVLGRKFNLFDPNEHSEFLYLAQHHGFPTPLLDWTESPFVAAYFAFHQLGKKVNEGDIRIFVFDQILWHKNKHANVNNIAEPIPSFCPFVIFSRDNPRALPQQSLVTYSNIYNIEEYIRHIEKEDKVKYLTVIDIKKSDRNNAMKDLEIMGITASSLFPGLDGVCQAIKEKKF